MFAHRALSALLMLTFSIPVFAGSEAPKSWRLLKKGTDGVPAANGEEGGRRRAPWIAVATDSKTFHEIWKREVPGRADEVDFQSETVIFLLLGVQSTGGYAIEPISADPPEGGVVRVHARLIQPMGDEPVTEALTAPFAVIAVRAREIRKVEWIDADGRLLATRIVE